MGRSSVAGAVGGSGRQGLVGASPWEERSLWKLPGAGQVPPGPAKPTLCAPWRAGSFQGI